jgi:two-component system, oxyanion-binding sensor
MSGESLRIGFIPLTDAAALMIAADKGFAAKQGLSLDLVREVSWSNVRDKLNIGLFDAAHLLAPVAVASSLGIGHIKVSLWCLLCWPRTATPSPSRRRCIAH